MKQDRVQWLTRELIRNPYYVGLCTSEDAFHRALRRLRIPKDKWPEMLRSPYADAMVHEFTHPKTKRAIAIVCIKRTRRLRCEVDGLLIHEAVHVWQWVKQHIGEADPSKEFEAYSIQGIAQNLIYAHHGR